jgi:hypothetical protein
MPDAPPYGAIKIKQRALSGPSDSTIVPPIRPTFSPGHQTHFATSAL